MKRVDAILIADVHLRLSPPLSRTDDFEAAQWKKLEEIKVLQEKYDCDVIHSGDLFEHWKPSPELLAKTIQHLPDNFNTVYGNHDLPQHNLGLKHKSGIYALEKAGKLTVLQGTHWEEEDPLILDWKFPDDISRSIVVWHIGTYRVREPYPGCPDKPGRTLLRKINADLIITGHNHQPFTEKIGSKLLVNPGCMTRQEANQKEYKPAVWLYDAKLNEVTPHYLTIDEGVISSEHIEITKERDERIEAFISKLDSDFIGGLDFLSNLEQFMSENKTSRKVKQIINEIID